MIIKTPTGKIEAKESTDPSFPGIWISINGEELVLVDHVAHLGGHVIRVWDHKNPNDDFEYSQFIPDEGNMGLPTNPQDTAWAIEQWDKEEGK